MASNLLYDFRWLHPTAWVYWQVMDPCAGWAMIAYDPAPYSRRGPDEVLRHGPVQPPHPPRHEDPRHGRQHRGGLRRRAKLVIVAVNTGAAQTLTFDLSAFTTVSGGVTRWTTVPAGTDRYTRRTDVSLNGKSVSLAFPAASVQTIEIAGVTA